MGILIPVSPDFINEQTTNESQIQTRAFHGRTTPSTGECQMVEGSYDTLTKPTITKTAMSPIGSLTKLMSETMSRQQSGEPTLPLRKRRSDRSLRPVFFSMNSVFWDFDELEEFIETLKHNVYFVSNNNMDSLYASGEEDYELLKARVQKGKKNPLQFKLAKERRPELAEWIDRHIRNDCDLDFSSYDNTVYLRVRDDVEEIHAKLRWY